MVSLYFYRRDSRWMQAFYRRMTFSHNCRKLFVSGLLFLLLSFNFVYLHAYGVTLGFVMATFVCMSLFFYKFTARVFHRLQDMAMLGMMLLVTLVSALSATTWPIAMNLYVIIIGSIFFPSKTLLDRLADPKEFTKLATSGKPVIELPEHDRIVFSKVSSRLAYRPKRRRGSSSGRFWPVSMRQLLKQKTIASQVQRVKFRRKGSKKN